MYVYPPVLKQNVLCNISAISQPITVKFWILNLLTSLNNLMIPYVAYTLVSRDLTLVLDSKSFYQSLQTLFYQTLPRSQYLGILPWFLGLFN